MVQKQRDVLLHLLPFFGDDPLTDGTAGGGDAVATGDEDDHGLRYARRDPPQRPSWSSRATVSD